MSTVNVLRPTTNIVCRDKKFEIGIPNIGEYIQIESLKQALTQGRYALMAFGALETSEKALDLVDSIVYFTVLAGKSFLETYGVKSHEDLLNLPITECEELTYQYKEVYAPFYNSIVSNKDRPIQKIALDKKAKESKVAKQERPEFDETHKESKPTFESTQDNKESNVIYSSQDGGSQPPLSEQ